MMLHLTGSGQVHPASERMKQSHDWQQRSNQQELLSRRGKLGQATCSPCRLEILKSNSEVPKHPMDDNEVHWVCLALHSGSSRTNYVECLYNKLAKVKEKMNNPCMA